MYPDGAAHTALLFTGGGIFLPVYCGQEASGVHPMWKIFLTAIETAGGKWYHMDRRKAIVLAPHALRPLCRFARQKASVRKTGQRVS